jgi:hypothetical protein
MNVTGIPELFDQVPHRPTAQTKWTISEITESVAKGMIVTVIVFYFSELR